MILDADNVRNIKNKNNNEESVSITTEFKTISKKNLFDILYYKHLI